MESIQTNDEVANIALNLKLGEENLIKIAKALSSKTRQTILRILNEEPKDVSRIAAILGQTEANVSAQIAILQKIGLVSCNYQPGGHGVRKICSVAVREIQIDLF